MTRREHIGTCIHCDDPADGFDDDGNLVCGDCLFERICDAEFADATELEDASVDEDI